MVHFLSWLLKPNTRSYFSPFLKCSFPLFSYELCTKSEHLFYFQCHALKFQCQASNTVIILIWNPDWVMWSCVSASSCTKRVYIGFFLFVLLPLCKNPLAHTKIPGLASGTFTVHSILSALWIQWLSFYDRTAALQWPQYLLRASVQEKIEF